MQKEPSNWEKVLAIIYGSGLSNDITSRAKSHEQQIRRYLSEDKHIFDVKMTGQRIVDLWLNTVFAHGGIEGKNRRSDFESAVNQFGHGAFEWSFRHLVKWIGRGFLEISNSSAKPALIFYQTNFSLSPSFKISAAFGLKRKEKTKDGHIIIREGSSEYFTEETFEERYSRILNREENRDLQFIFQLLDRTPTELLRATLGADSFAAMLAALEGQLEVHSTEQLPSRNDVHALALGWVGFTRVFPRDNHPVHIYEDCIVATNGKGLQAIEELLTSFRAQLLER